MKVATHPGNFHADDVFAVAVLQLAARAARDRPHARRGGPGRPPTSASTSAGARTPRRATSTTTRRAARASARTGSATRASGWCGASTASGSPAAPSRRRPSTRCSCRASTPTTRARRSPRPLVEDVAPMTVSGVIGALNPRWDEDLTRPRRTRGSPRPSSWPPGSSGARSPAPPRSGGARSLVEAAIGRAGDPRVIELDSNMPWRETVITTAPDALFVMYPKSDGWGSAGGARDARLLRQPPRLPGRLARAQRRRPRPTPPASPTRSSATRRASTPPPARARASTALIAKARSPNRLARPLGRRIPWHSDDRRAARPRSPTS